MESLEDYQAMLNLKGYREIWKYNHPRISFVLKKVKAYIKKGNNICEISISDGYFLKLLYPLNVNLTGIDKSNYLINELKKIFKSQGHDIELIDADISKPLTFEMKHDIVFALDILEHLKGEGIKQAVHNVYNLLKNDGLFIGILPWKENLKNKMVKCPNCGEEFHHVGHYHSFHLLEDIKEMLIDYFKLIQMGFIKPRTPFSRINFELQKNFLSGLASRLGLPLVSYTCYFIAKKIKKTS
ncbi:MAG: class I SAM-dependent methyltransferase [Promethearchaeia archaeon]